MIATIDTLDALESQFAPVEHAIPTIRNESDNGDFDITRFLVPDHVYDHAELKQAIYDACNAGFNCELGDLDFRSGSSFFKVVTLLWEQGWIEMTQVEESRTDFFHAVLMSFSTGRSGNKVIPGYLVLHTEPMEIN